MADVKSVSSRQNPAVREAAALLTPAGRKKADCFLLEGARLVSDAVNSGRRFSRLFLTPAAKEKYPDVCEKAAAVSGEVLLVTDEVARRLSDTEAPQGVFAVAKKEAPPLTLDPDGFYVVTDRLQNPDNLGALSRTAEAFGADGLILSGGCDRYAPKALRASMGALLRLPVLQTPDVLPVLSDAKKKNMRVFGAVLSPEAVDVRSVDKSGGKLLVIGNEGAGISPEIKAACTDLVIIPMSGRAESLNAAAAAAILIWEMRR